jgi:predicted outer membrane repeat protein
MKRQNILNAFFALVLALGAVAGTPVAPAYADNIDICPEGCDHNNLADALAAAAASGDTILISADTFTLAGNIIINKDVTIRGTSRDATIISGGDLYNITIAAGKTVGIKDLTITDGYVNGNGGAIANHGVLTLENVVIQDSVSDLLNFGGGIFNNGSLTITDSVIQNNQARRGGGIQNQASATLDLDNVNIINNTTTGQQGGGINIEANSGAVTINQTVISGNTAYGGGGIYSASSFTFTNGAVVNNTANTASGGGIGAYDFFSTTTLKNVTISGNTALGSGADGGGIYNQSELIFNNVTIVNNSADDQGGGLLDGRTTTIITNSILANNTSVNNVSHDCSTGVVFSIASMENSLLKTTTGCTITSQGGNITGQDPKLDALEYLGTTYAHYPQYDSPAIDAGDIAVCETTDQIGDPRPMGPSCDMGAVEYVSNGVVLNNSGDPNEPGSLPWTYAHSFGNITFAPSLSGQTITLSAAIRLTDTTTIDGYALASPVTISGGGVTSMFEVGGGVYATLIRINLAEGYNAFDGGAIYNNGTLYLDTVNFTNNTADRKGGAIYNEGAGVLAMGGNTFTNNSAEDGGAIYSQGVNIFIETSTFTGNTASLHGGALMAFSNEITISDSSFTNNSASDQFTNTTNNGGAIAMEDGSLHVVRSTFTNNTTAEHGGAIYLQNNSADFTDTVFDANQSMEGGAIWAYKNAGVMEITATRSLFKNNHANRPTFYAVGGAIYSGNVDLDIRNSTFSGNTATAGSNWARGGGIFHEGTGDLFVNNSTFSGNAVLDNDPVNAITTEGGAVYTQGTGNIEILNSILANSIGNSDCYHSGNTLTPTNSLIENNAAGGSCGTPASTADPKLAPLANNGGLTQTLALLPGSPAIDAGNPASCEAADQRGVTRPLGVACDIGAYEAPVSLKKTFRSTAAQDGWILESTETSNKGGALNRNATTLQLGDDAARKQYLSILSFDTSSIPDNAVITKVTLKVKQQGITGGGNPVNMFQGFMVDIKRGSFGAPALVVSDFQAKAQKTLGPIKKNPNGSGWYVLNITPGKNFVNKLASGNGLTQIRLRFTLDDNNNNAANFLKLFSGNAPAANRPQLIVEYYVP